MESANSPENLPRVFLRYWGSHFKSARQALMVATLFSPIAERGWQCHLVLERLPDDPAWTEALLNLGVKFHLLPRPRGQFDLRCVRQIRTLCKQTRCDVFQCDNMHTSPLLGATAARVPIKIWWKRSMSAHYEEGREPGWKERMALSTRLSFHLATRVFAVSSAVRDELVSLGAPAARVLVLNNPRPKTKAPHMDRKGVRKRLGYKPTDLIFVSVGHSVPVKGWDLLLSAFVNLLTLDSRVQLLLVGSHSSPEERLFFKKLEKFIAMKDMGDRVRFTGYCSDVPSLLAASDVFVLPSRSEGCCNALIEALASGLPCIATRVGSAVETLGDGRSGILVARDDVGALEHALAELVLDDGLRTRLSESATIPDHILTAELHAERIASIYAAMLAADSQKFSPSRASLPTAPSHSL